MLEECRQYAGQIFVLEVDGAVAGFTTVYTRVPFDRLDEPPGDYAIIAELLVRREYRRRGYARALLAHGERYAAAQGATELRIGVLSDNTAARALYLDYGFRPYIETLSKSPSHRLPASWPSPAIVRCRESSQIFSYPVAFRLTADRLWLV